VDFIGAEALRKVQAEGGPQRRLFGLEMIDRGIARDGYPVFSLDGKPIGQVTSGSPAPFLKKNIALAYLPASYADTVPVASAPPVPEAHPHAHPHEVLVGVRSSMVRARIVPMPFYKRPKKTSTPPVDTAAIPAGV
jgi:aminomethyltransferase